MRASASWALQRSVGCCLLLFCPLLAHADALAEYRIKAAFLYNFARYTEWPTEVGSTLALCILGEDPFGPEIDALQGKPVGERSLAIRHKDDDLVLQDCQIVFIAPSAAPSVASVLRRLGGRPVLTVADTPGAARDGVALNMIVAQGRVAFEANLLASRAAGLKLSSNLLQLATQVIQ